MKRKVSEKNSIFDMQRRLPTGISSRLNGASGPARPLHDFRLRVDESLARLLLKAETTFPSFESTDVIRKCARWINRSTSDSISHEIEKSGYEPSGNLDRIIFVRSCEKTDVSCEDFRAILYGYITKALAMPKPEKFVLSQCGVRTMNEEDFVRLFNAGQKNTTGMVIIKETAEE